MLQSVLRFSELSIIMDSIRSSVKRANLVPKGRATKCIKCGNHDGKYRINLSISAQKIESNYHLMMPWVQLRQEFKVILIPC